MEFKIAGFTFNLINCIIFFALGMLVSIHTICSCSKVTLKEGLQMLSNAASVGDSMSLSQSPDSWSEKALQYAGNMGYQTMLQKYQGNKGTPVPLQNTLFYFQDNEFKPECCPATYSTGDGCACMSVKQLEYLNERGGNRTHSSNF